MKVRSYAYDCVLNGYEIGGGSQRIHNQDLQKRIFELLDLSEDDIKNRMGFFIEALKYGTPPHLGLAFGVDRIMMIICDTDNIKDVIAFPKTNLACDLMMSSPSIIGPKQLNELKIKTLAE
jgi:aspartyl-tRNA synthetase